MSNRNHSICERCWVEREPHRWPTRVIGEAGEGWATAQVCCFCGNPTWVGIFIRDEPGQAFCDHDQEFVAVNGDEGDDAA